MIRQVIWKYRDQGFHGILREAANRLLAIAGPEHPHGDRSPMRSALDWLAKRPSFSIVQIGAYVGDSDSDPLCRFLREQFGPMRADRRNGCQVVLVEPVREYFERLCENYKDLSDVYFENVAIAETEEVRDFFRLAVDPTEYGYPDWLCGLGSLKAERMTRLWDRYERNQKWKEFYLRHRVVERVRCTTLEKLFDRYQIKNLDLLQMDAEGYDYEILRSLDLNRIRPRFVNYERVLLQDDEEACRGMMKDAGYLLVDWGQDTFCSRVV